MPGIQFVQIELYARGVSRLKKSAWIASDIAAEAERVPDNSRHVKVPQAPTILFGVAPTVALKNAEAGLEMQRDPIGRRVRKDTPCLLAGVASYPKRTGNAPIEEVMGWALDCVSHLQNSFGSDLRGVLLHMDEEYPHVHFYAAPDDGRAKKLHPGHRHAKERAKGGFKGGMRAWQDAWFEAISIRYGMARTGPKRERLNRKEWRARQRAAERLSQAQVLIDASESLKISLNARQNQIDDRLRQLEKEQRALEIRADELTKQEMERLTAIDRRQESLKSEKSALDIQTANIAKQAEQLVVAGRKFIELKGMPETEKDRRLKGTEDDLARVNEDFKKTQTRLQGMEDTLQRNADRIQAMEAMMTRGQHARLELMLRNGKSERADQAALSSGRGGSSG